MSNGWRALRRRILTPHVSATALDKRGFHEKDLQSKERLETIGRTFLEGYACAVRARGSAEAAQGLKFPASRQSDLYAGAGLAATYAGGADEDELRRFADRAGEHQRMVAQRAAFAAEARVHGGIVVPRTELGAPVFCGATAAVAPQVTQDFRPDDPVDGELPACETWRQDIAKQFVSIGRC